MLIDVDLILGEAVRLGVLDRLLISVRAKSKDPRGWRAREGERGVEVAEVCARGIAVAEKDGDCSEVGVDSSIAGAAPWVCPAAAWSCCSCSC